MMAPAARQFDVAIFDLTGLSDLPPQMAEALTQAKAAGREIEILNPSPRIQDFLRGAEFDSILIQGST
ncbi:MAG: hypothetical protein HY290_30445 [Planctomycetia bacterium]|nr:hypothetical protein [Planctomycetia bacterium]